MDRKVRVDYASKEYWNERYAEEDHFEWISNGYQKQLDTIATKGGCIHDFQTTRTTLCYSRNHKSKEKHGRHL